jgi:hypothetical protein
MPGHFRLSVAAVGLLVLLAGCGVSGASGASASRQNTSPSTSSGGPLDIGTDHSHYAGVDTIRASVISHLSGAVYAFDTHTSCSIFSLELLVNGSWQGSSAGRCAMARVARPVELVPGTVYVQDIYAGAIPHSRETFQSGTYRLALTYFSSPTPGTGTASGTTVYSARFTIVGGATSLAPPSSAPGGIGPAQPPRTP